MEGVSSETRGEIGKRGRITMMILSLVDPSKICPW